MKKIKLSEKAVDRAVQALDEVETAVLGRTIPRIRTDVRAGLDGGPGCKPWLCPMPLYGVPMPTEF